MYLIQGLQYDGKNDAFRTHNINVVLDLTKKISDHYEANKNKTFITEKEKNDWKIFMLDWLQPNISLPALQSVKCPALIIAGDHDLIVAQHTLAIYQSIPKAYLWIVPNSSHSTLIEHTDEFNKKVNDFFTKKW